MATTRLQTSRGRVIHEGGCVLLCYSGAPVREAAVQVGLLNVADLLLQRDGRGDCHVQSLVNSVALTIMRRALGRLEMHVTAHGHTTPTNTLAPACVPLPLATSYTRPSFRREGSCFQSKQLPFFPYRPHPPPLF